MSPMLIYGVMATCSVCYVFQGFFSKLYSLQSKGDDRTATLVFSSLYGLIVGTIVLVVGARLQFAPSAITWAAGVANGLVLFLYNMGIVKASRSGPYAFQSILALIGGVLLPTLFATTYWGDAMSPKQIVGAALMLVSFVLINSQRMSFSGVKGSYFAWVGVLALTNGLYSILLDSQQRIMAHTQRAEMIVITFFTSGLISLINLLFVHKGEAFVVFRIGKRAGLYAAISSVSAALAVYQMAWLLGKAPSPVIFTVLNGTVLAMSVLLSAVVLKEKISRSALAGILLVLVSLVFLAA